MEEKILQELFEKRSDTESQKVNKKMDNRLSKLAISEKVNMVILMNISLPAQTASA